jgi:diaminohydroxyphosphoribosylaminopyrimidine deaminase/5-amino-6-(5-phosphoribosylamino)uracil reductase
MTDNQSADDVRFMNLALREARKGIGLTSPNPPVGCVIVKRREVIGRGFHKIAGGPHAEVVAMGKVSPRRLRGATAYVTLEPCSTHGKTPPCCEALIASGVARVVYGATDPNPDHSGRGKALLEFHEIEVTDGVGRAECEAQLRPWSKFITSGIPWVIAKAGTSLDGRLTRPRGEGQWLTSEGSRADAQKLRGEVDAILIGAGTLRADDPALTLRDPAALKRGKIQPLRAVISRSGKLPARARLFTDAFRDRTVVYRGGTLRAALKDLATRGCVSVLIEGGGGLLGDAFRSKLVDEVCLYMAPILCGEGCVPLAGARLPASAELADVTIKKIGDDLRVRGLVR